MNGRIVFFTLLSATLAFLLAPLVLKSKGPHPTAKAINNAKQIGIAMTEFESQYGHFPIPHDHGDFIDDYPIQERTDSNYLLGQLLASKVLDSEKVFYMRGKEADDIFSTPEKNLEAGECQFSYISKAGQTALNYSDFPAETPIVLGPMIAGTKLFDRDYLGKSHCMVYLKLDSSIATCDIALDGKALIDKSTNLGLLDTGKDTIWGDRAPTIHHPLAYSNAPNDKFLQRQQQWKVAKNLLYVGFILAVVGLFSIPMIKNKIRQPAS